MHVDDITIEVRDRNLKRVGQITPSYLDMKGRTRWCGVGEWTVNLPGGHPMIEHLDTPGSGIIALGPSGTPDGVMFSGPTRNPLRTRNQQNPDGTYSFSGVTDEVVLQGALAFPDPSIADPQASSQSRANDTRSGVTEDLMRSFVAFNVANGAVRPSGATTWAPAGRLRGLRRSLVLAEPGGGRGVQQQKSPRFQNLLELLQEMNAYDPSVGFRVVQVGGLLEFQVIEARDRTKFVRFDVDNGTITSEEVMHAGPVTTDAIVAGQGDGTARTIVQRRDAVTIAAEEEWAVPFEVFIDQRNTDDLAELQQAGDEAILDGRGGVAVKMVPADDNTMQVGTDWRQGDTVTTVVDDSEPVARVTEVAYVANASGVIAGAALGDVSGFTAKDAESKTVESLDQRVSNLERADVVRTSIQDWGGKGGPTGLAAQFRNTWAKGADNGGSIDAKSDPTAIIIKETGHYEVVATQRASPNAPQNAYIAISQYGNRQALEDRVEGIWTHDHAAGNNNASVSRYIGLLLKGEKIAAGSDGATSPQQYGTASHLGTLTVRRIS